MSQYPNPYQQPYQPPVYGPGYYAQDPLGPLLGPARRASILMFVLGGLSLACGLCFGGFSFFDFANIDGVPPQQLAELQRMESEMGVSIRTLFMLMSAITLVPGILWIVVGYFVRGGGMGAAISGLILTVIMTLLVGVNILTGLPALAANPAASIGLCILAIPLALLVLLGVWLIQAIRNAPRIADLRLGQHGQYMHSMQQAQMYQQGGHYPQQSPPPPPPPGGQDQER